jgi:hypothetical protein
MAVATVIGDPAVIADLGMTVARAATVATVAPAATESRAKGAKVATAAPRPSSLRRS